MPGYCRTFAAWVCGTRYEEWGGEWGGEGERGRRGEGERIAGVCSKHEEKDELSESGKLTDRTDANKIEHNEESIEKYHANDLVKKWLDNNDFSHLPGPENVHNLENGTESISLESLCLQNNIELSAILSNIVICESKVDSEIIDESVDDDSCDKGFNILDFTQSNTSTSGSDKIDCNYKSCFENGCLAGLTIDDNINDEVFDKMRGDEVSFVAKTDLLIAHFGETFLKKHKRERMIYACSNRMRELARLLISYRNLTNNAEISFKDLLHPKNFDIVLSAARNVVGYDPLKKTFKSPRLAMHIGTSLKLASDELSHLILKEDTGFKCKTSGHISEWLNNVKNFKKLIESRWNSELASLANKDLQEKRWNKPLLLPLVNDIKIFRDECLKIAVQCTKIFTEEKDDIKTYTLLVNCTLALLIVFNRRRIGDVQFLKIADYEKDHRSNFVDFENALTKTEKMLATKYKRVLNSGKGSRAVVLLIPENLQNYFDLLLTKREKYISAENDYLCICGSGKLPVDIYQTARVSKLLLMVEKGIPIEHKGKSLADINFNINLEYAEESDDDDNGVIPLSKNLHVNPEETLELIANDQPERKDNNKTSSADSSEADEMVFLGKKRSQNKRRKMDITQNCITTAGNFEEFNRHKKTTTKRGNPHDHPFEDGEESSDVSSICSGNSDTTYIPSTEYDSDTPKSVEIPIRSPVLVNVSLNIIIVVESQWTTELGSLALKDLNEKAAVKPKLLPVTEDIVKLKNFAEQSAEESYELLKSTKSIPAYKTLAETTLVLTILHNRKRVGDIQYLELNCYSEQINNNTNGTVQTEMATSLTENEKILTQHYKRIVSIGKGSRAVTILIPKKMQKLPQDIYQVAKISKILQLMEQGNATQFKNKCLEEIDIDMENIEDVTQNNRNADVERREIENTDADDWIENNRTNTESTDATENNRTNTESTEATENNIYSNTHESNGESSDNGTYIPSIETSILEYI
ncbi:hypothetical protein MML48_4g00006583 [Holotrichia oblita]|uniref:Uncharacterized protein n=1 Tax=Holotrichia oblita TaxID=644536 RepID=A0ACB9T957_HOLOL|nr:hypothetical protein MML48_4g00006583 [Holotrichia oblita]